MTSLARTIDYCQRRGWPVSAATVFDFADVLAIDGRFGSLAIHVTTPRTVAAAIAAVIADDVVKTWLVAGNRLEVHAWERHKLHRHIVEFDGTGYPHSRELS